MHSCFVITGHWCKVVQLYWCNLVVHGGATENGDVILVAGAGGEHSLKILIKELIDPHDSTYTVTTLNHTRAKL